MVQILQSLLVSLQLLGGRSLLGKFGEAKLLAKQQSVSELRDNIEVVQFCRMFRSIEKPSDNSPSHKAYRDVLVSEKS